KTSKKKLKRNKLDEYKAKSHPRSKLLPCEEPDVSRILKITETGQVEEPDDSFDHPLHSTAVDAGGNVELQEEEHDMSASHSSDSSPQGKNADTRYSENKIFSSPGKLLDNVWKTYAFFVPDSPFSMQIWCPKGLKRFSQDITELDVVLVESEKITADYKQRVESRICREAIAVFYSGFKEQLTNTVSIVVNIKTFVTGPQLKQLQREYAELQERESSLRNATQFLTDLKEVQQQYINCREDHPQEKVVYGTSSIPALLVESQRILRAESHFQNISTRLQEFLNLQKKELPEKL
uniref:Centromere protein U n=1 Tax=Chelonoidis abingdonii TaxID=106734 RepID=A0A8C0GRA1_CHEAB